MHRKLQAVSGTLGSFTFVGTSCVLLLLPQGSSAGTVTAGFPHVSSHRPVARCSSASLRRWMRTLAVVQKVVRVTELFQTLLTAVDLSPGKPSASPL